MSHMMVDGAKRDAGSIECTDPCSNVNVQSCDTSCMHFVDFQKIKLSAMLNKAEEQPDSTIQFTWSAFQSGEAVFASGSDDLQSSGIGESGTIEGFALCSELCTDYFQCHLETTAMQNFKVAETKKRHKKLCNNVAEALEEEGYVGIYCSDENMLTFADQATCLSVLEGKQHL